MFGVCIYYYYVFHISRDITFHKTINLEGLNHHYCNLNHLLEPALHNMTTGVGSEQFLFRYRYPILLKKNHLEGKLKCSKNIY